MMSIGEVAAAHLKRAIEPLRSSRGTGPSGSVQVSMGKRMIERGPSIESMGKAPGAQSPIAAVGDTFVRPTSLPSALPMPDDDQKLVICQSKAISHLFTRIRDRNTPPARFSFYASRMMRILVEEGIACFRSTRPFITTPTGATFSSIFVDESNICIVSILRAGDALADAAKNCLPDAPVGKFLIQRDEESEDKRPVLFYKKLPKGISSMQVLLCDPMLATGNTAIMAVHSLVAAGVQESSIVLVTVVVCPEGLAALSAVFPALTVVTAAVDDCLDERKYILPGLGDFGDRFYGTVP